jgi:hypothetical protein
MAGVLALVSSSWGNVALPAGRLQHVDERGDCRPETAVDHGEVEIGRVAVLSEMYEAECRSALEDQAPTVRGPRPVQLGGDVGEDIIPFHDPSVDSVGVDLANDRVASEHGSVSDDGSKLIHRGAPCNAEDAINPLVAVIGRVEVDDRLSRSDPWLQAQGQRQGLGERREATLRGEAPGSKCLRQLVKPGRIGLRCSFGQSLCEPLGSPGQVDPEGALEERPLQGRAPGALDGFGFEADCFGLLDDDSDGPAADGPEANLVSACDEDGANGVGEQSEFTQSAQIGDPVLATVERGSNGLREIVRRWRGAE